MANQNITKEVKASTTVEAVDKQAFPMTFRELMRSQNIKPSPMQVSVVKPEELYLQTPDVTTKATMKKPAIS